jgi:hypothetical protein
MVNTAEFYRLQFVEDKRHLDQLEYLWIWCLMGKLVEEDPEERRYYERLEATAWELITQLQGKIVRRYT